ncbi:MAG TPA: hypothetical protein VLZ72_04095, partial [Flavobacterium sp.]|nr:hypothetical protein [Flavobacterium sp.]
KHRNGATGDVRLRFRPEAIRFENLTDESYGGGFGLEADAAPMTLGSRMNEPSDLTLPSVGNNPFNSGGSIERNPDF